MRLDPDIVRPTHEMRDSHAGVLKLASMGRDRGYMHAVATHGEFIAWDGEGYSTADGDHHYMLLQVSTGDRIHGEQLTTRECLDFILRHYQAGAIHVIYGGGYDATNWLRDITEEMQLQLLREGKVSLRFVEPGRTPATYDIEYMPSKWFAVTGRPTPRDPIRTVKIFDVVTFFASAFIKALQSRGIEVPDVITSGKAQRSDFTYADLEEISVYCGMELTLLVQLCEQLRDEFREAGIPIASYHGPGAVANAVLKQHKVRAHREEVPDRAMENIIRYAYFGGRFEQFKAGHHDQPVYLYDINSAYPYQISQLPDLAGARWIYADTFDPAGIGLWYCTAASDDRVRPHASPWRGKGGVVGFPAVNAGVWLMTPEAVHAERVLFGYRLELAHPGEQPFGFIPEMFETRRAWKAEGRGGERALKGAMNSIYGKLAQTVSADRGRPRQHEMTWAALITSGTRAMLWDAISQAPESIIAVETDSVLSTVPLQLPIGEGLGEWEETILPDVTYLQSGVYFADGGAAKNKTRGLDPSKLEYSDVLAWLEAGMKYPLTVTETRFIGITNWNRRPYMGRWETRPRAVRLAGGKRIHAEAWCDACTAGAGYHEQLHTLTARPTYGHEESRPHVLPWLDQVTVLENDAAWAGEAVREWESPRH